MQVFISWSGETSKKIAQALNNWMPRNIQAIKTYFSDDNILKGQRWLNEISRELDKCTFGIFCLTKDNLQSPWMMFEAGSIAKSIDKSRVCPLAFGISASDVQYPLAQFQAAEYSKSEITKLMHSINSQLDHGKLPESVLDELIDDSWNKLDNQISNILKSSTESSSSNP